MARRKQDEGKQEMIVSVKYIVAYSLNLNTIRLDETACLKTY